MADAKRICPECGGTDLVMLVVDLGDEAGYEAVHFCPKCQVVFAFQPLDELGPVIRVEADGVWARG